MLIKPLTLKEANTFVEELHRHHKKVVGHRFSIGAFVEDKLIGIAICGRPVCREYNSQEVLEVTRLCTDGTYNACSKLYSAAARVGKEMGFKTIQTYILDSEPGTSLIASGWKLVGITKGRSWSIPNRPRVDKHPVVDKKRFERTL